MNQPATIRASSLPGFADCPRRAAAKAHRREIQAAGFDLNRLPSGIGASVGTAVHAGAALMMAEKAERGTPAPVSAAQDAAVETLREQAGSQRIEFDITSPNLNTAEKQAVRMTSAYARVIVPQVQPIRVEQRLTAQVTPNITLSGQSDVVAAQPDGIVRDLKTGAKRGNYRPQLGAYSLLERAHKRDVAGVVEDYVPRVAITKVQPDPVSIPHDVAGAEAAAWAILRHMEADLLVFREGDPANGILPGDPWAWAANPSSMLCNAKYCPAHGTAFCREHQ